MARLTKVEKAAAKAKNEARIAEAVAVVRANKCPQCGAGIRRNNAMTGWHQCEQYGAEGFRKDSSKPSCSYQCFTC